MSNYDQVVLPMNEYIDWSKPFVEPEERPVRTLAIFVCCLLVCPAIWAGIGVAHSKRNTPSPEPTLSPTLPVPSSMPTSSPTPSTPTPSTPTPSAPAPTPSIESGACCCEQCSLDRCINQVASQEDCNELCDPAIVKRSHSLDRCIATFTEGSTCAECACEGPLDCCPDDPFVIEGSIYASADLTLCGTRDYNCDGSDDQLPCCYSDKPAPNNVDARTVYVATMCNASHGNPLSSNPDEVCGACTGTDVIPGWKCSTPYAVRKRFVPPCPDQCEPQIVTPLLRPDNGECALFVDHCVGEWGGDGEQCCIVVSH